MDTIDSCNLLIWKKSDSEIDFETNYVVQDHHQIKNSRVIVLNELTAREIYSVLLLSSGNIPTSQKCYSKIFANEILDWKKIYKYSL